MRKWSWILGLLFLSVAVAYGAWDPTHPTDDELKKDVPGWVRANWNAIATGTDPALQITNAKVAASAGIVDTKLATISTPGKVTGPAITGLASVPSGAGALPVANGGTAATSASAARSSLGAAASGANNDITSLMGISTPLGIAYGGTGSASQNFVDLTAGQTVAGVKTFSSFPVSPSSAPTTDYQFANKKYVDDKQTTTSHFYASSGTFTAPAGVTEVFVTMVGGGGGGGGYIDENGTGGCGGGAGAWVYRYPLYVTPTSNYSVTVGAKGTGGAHNAAGGNGTASSFVYDGGTITCAGGYGGGTNSQAGGAGVSVGSYNGQAGGGDGSAGLGGAFGIAITAGGNGGAGIHNPSLGAMGGGGAGGPFGGGGVGGTNARYCTVGYSYGSGGGGCSGYGGVYTGADGTQGFVYIEW